MVAKPSAFIPLTPLSLCAHPPVTFEVRRGCASQFVADATQSLMSRGSSESANAKSRSCGSFLFG